MAATSTTLSSILIIFIALIIIGAAHARHPHIEIQTKFGALQGLTQLIPDAHGPFKTIHKFLGIPYAASPTGKLRFAPPQPFKGWKTAFYDATYFRSVCMQSIVHYNESIRQAWEGFSEEDDISEDCLYLNVYAPAPRNNSNKLFPVLAYIHGGGFFAGTPVRVVSPGEYLPLREIILVTIQYRLGAFGFFSTGNATAPGNYGLLDQLEALKWIKEHIISFGGDASQITLFGESAGGASVNLHLLSPLSEGLFQRVIAESGTDLSPFAYMDKLYVSRSSAKLAKNLNCNTGNKDLTMQCLRRKDARDILKFASQGFFYPVVDEIFLQDSPINLRKMGKFRNVPVIAGFVSHEGSFLLDRSLSYTQPVMRKTIEAFISALNYTADPKFLADAMEFQYTPWPDHTNSSKIRQGIIDMYTDFYVVAPTHASLLFQSIHSSTWLYEFRHRSEFSKNEVWQGVAHGDITPYVFGAPLLNITSPRPYTDTDRNISEMLVTLYTNFVKNGTDMPKTIHGITWKRFTTNDRAYLRIERSPVMETNYYPSRVAFWNDYWPKISSQSIGCEGPDVKGTRNPSTRANSWTLLIGAMIALVWAAG